MYIDLNNVLQLYDNSQWYSTVHTIGTVKLNSGTSFTVSTLH